MATGSFLITGVVRRQWCQRWAKGKEGGKKEEERTGKERGKPNQTEPGGLKSHTRAVARALLNLPFSAVTIVEVGYQVRY